MTLVWNLLCYLELEKLASLRLANFLELWGLWPPYYSSSGGPYEVGIIYYGFSLQCSVCHDSARNKKKKSFVDILREKNGWCFLIAAATTSNPLFISVNTYQIPKPELVLLPFFFFPPSHFLHCCHAILLSCYCTVLFSTRRKSRPLWSCHWKQYHGQYILSKPQTWAGPPSLPFFPSLRHVFYIAAVDSCSTISSVVTAVVSAKIWNTDWGQLSGKAVQS